MTAYSLKLKAATTLHKVACWLIGAPATGRQCPHRFRLRLTEVDWCEGCGKVLTSDDRRYSTEEAIASVMAEHTK